MVIVKSPLLLFLKKETATILTGFTKFKFTGVYKT